MLPGNLSPRGSGLPLGPIACVLQCLGSTVSWRTPRCRYPTGTHLAAFIWKVLAATETFPWADCHQQMDLQQKANTPGNQLLWVAWEKARA